MNKLEREQEPDAQSARSSDDGMLGRIYRKGIFLFAAILVLAAIWDVKKALPGVFVGGVLAAGSFLWTQRMVDYILFKKKKLSPAGAAFLFSKIILLVLVLYAIVRSGRIGPIPLIVGFSVTKGALLAEGFHLALRSVKGHESASRPNGGTGNRT